MLGEAMLNGSVTFLREAIRLLTLIVAPHPSPDHSSREQDRVPPSPELWRDSVG